VPITADDPLLFIASSGRCAGRHWYLPAGGALYQLALTTIIDANWCFVWDRLGGRAPAGCAKTPCPDAGLSDSMAHRIDRDGFG
jgi:hypothetical protein